MKRSKLILALLLCLLSTVSWAQTVVTTPRVSTATTRYTYTLHCKATDHGGSYLGINDGNFNGRCAEENACKFEFELKEEGKYYIKSVDLGYLTANNGSITFENTPSTYWTIQQDNGAAFLLANGTSGVYLNNNKWSGDGIQTSSGPGDCSHWIFTEYAEGQPLTWSKPIVDGATYAIVNVQPSSSATRYYYLNNSNGTLTPVNATDKNTLSEWPTTAQFVAKDLGNGKFAFRNKSNGSYLAYKAFSATVENWSSWTMHESSRTGFENTYWFSCAKRDAGSNLTGAIIIKNDGTYDNYSDSEYTGTELSNNYGFVLLKESSNEPAGTVIANMQTLVTGATENNATAATNYETDVEGGAIYSFANDKFIKSITNTDLVNAYAGDKVITVAMWVYGSPTGCPFGYGDGGTGIKYRFVDGANWQITTKSNADFNKKTNASLPADQWNLVAFAVPAKANTAVKESRYYSGAEDANGFTSVSNTTSGMNIPVESGQKFAIGSGDQGTAREAFAGTLANLTIIESEGMLLYSEIAELLGEAPHLSPRAEVISEYREWKASLYDGEILKIGAPSEIAVESVEDVINNTDNNADAIRKAFNAVKTTNHLNLPTGYYYFRSIATDPNRQQPYLFNNYFLDNNTQHHTLQSESKVATNAGIWYIENRNDGTIAILNGDGQPLVQGNQGKKNNEAVSVRETLTFGAFNAQNFTTFDNQGIYFTEALNAANNPGTFSVNSSNETLFVTTWAGHPNARDNHWTFEPIEHPNNIYNVVIEGAPEGEAYVTMTDGQYAFCGGFLYGSDIAESQLTATEIDGKNYSINVKGKTITVSYFSDDKSVVTYVYKNGETEWYREKHIVEKDSDYPDIRTLPTGVKISTVPYGKVSDNATIEIECTVDDKYDIPFSSSYDNAKWLYATVNSNNKYFWSYDSGTKHVKTNVTAFTTAKRNEAYMWAIIGNPIAGYQIINKAAGADMILTSASPKGDGANGGNTFPVMTNKNEVPGNHNVRWNIATYDFGYAISREGENINFYRRGNDLAYWTGKDAGSRVGFFPIEDVIEEENPMEGGKTYQARNLMSGEIITDFTGMTISTGNVDGCYHLSSAASVTTTPAIFYASQSISATENPVQWSPLSAFSEWIIEEKTEDLFDLGEPEYVNSITSGNYYRLYCIGRENRLMTDKYSSTKGVTGAAAFAGEETGSQIWKIVKTGDASGTVDNYTLQNVLTGRYIGDQSATSNIFPVKEESSSAKAFVTQTGTADDETVYFTFSRALDGDGLHLDAGSNVVKWTSSAAANRWALDEVELSQEQLDAYAAFYNDYKTKLSSITHAELYQIPLDVVFADKACTQLKSEYASKTDQELRDEIGASLPQELQDMAISVKNDKWDNDVAKNRYVKDFRIHSYDIYSDPDVWANVTKVGRFSNLYHPTGIACKSGELLYVMVSDEPKDSDAKLELGITTATNNNPAQVVTLKAGLNIIMPAADGEAFVLYRLTNKDKYLSEYPNITVHIEGGEATGCFDMHRGHTNNDWAYLCSNMFTNKYLHLMAENTAFCVESERVRGAENIIGSLKIWDFIFMTEEKLIGHDGQWNGKYNPVIVARDQYSGNPNWSGTSANYSGIYKDGLLNYNSLLNGDRWVIYHEEAHGHQYPVNLAATTESSNNGFAQMVNHEFGLSSRRANGTKTLMTFKNEGWGWVDILRGGEGISRSNNFAYYGDALWLQNHMFYQLYLYFHVAGNMPDFWPRLCDEMRSNGGLIKKSSPTDPTSYYEDYLKFALAAAKVSKTDLSEFFDSYGFFDYYEDVKVGNDFTGFREKEENYASAGVRYVGDYGGYYMKMPMKSNQADVDRINAAIAEMKAYPNKAPNIMFIDDHIKDRTVADTAFAVTLDPSLAGQPVKFYDNSTGIQGDFGDMSDFNGQNEANALDYSIEGDIVTMTGSGLVGVKIYDAEGNLKYIYNTTTFTLAEGVADKLNDGTYTLVAALGNDTNLPLAKPGAKTVEMLVYNGNKDNEQTYTVTGNKYNNVPYSACINGTDVPALKGNEMALFPNVEFIGHAITLPTTNAFYKNGSKLSTYLFELQDKEDFYLPTGYTYSVEGGANYKRSNTAGYNTVCLPFNVKAENFITYNGCKVYVFNGLNNDKTSVSFREAPADEEIIAGMPILVYSEGGADWVISNSDNANVIGSTSESGNITGAFQKRTLGLGYYKLNSAGTKFVKTTASSTITPFRFYLDTNGEAPSSSFSLVLEDNDDLTDTESAIAEESMPRTIIVYDLQGNVVTTLKSSNGTLEELKAEGLDRGIYIVDKKKIQIP